MKKSGKKRKPYPEQVSHFDDAPQDIVDKILRQPNLTLMEFMRMRGVSHKYKTAVNYIIGHRASLRTILGNLTHGELVNLYVLNKTGNTDINAIKEILPEVLTEKGNL